jgi:hypothetical protein
MNTITATAQEPSTIAAVKDTNRYAICKSHAQGYIAAGNALSDQATGQLTSRKLFFDFATNQVVYVFYRKKAEHNKFYIIY